MCICLVVRRAYVYRILLDHQFSPLRRVPILISMDHPMLSTACWHTNNQITTTLKHQHALKKHIQKKHILCASIFKQEGGSGSIEHSSAASEVEPYLIPQSCMHCMINIGSGIYFTKSHNHPKNLRTVERLFIRLPCLVFDCGRGQWAANRSRATVGIQQHAMSLSCFLGFMLMATRCRMRRVLSGMGVVPIAHEEEEDNDNGGWGGGGNHKEDNNDGDVAIGKG
jgi:hypothetical protein